MWGEIVCVFPHTNQPILTMYFKQKCIIRLERKLWYGSDSMNIVVGNIIENIWSQYFIRADGIRIYLTIYSYLQVLSTLLLKSFRIPVFINKGYTTKVIFFKISYQKRRIKFQFILKRSKKTHTKNTTGDHVGNIHLHFFNTYAKCKLNF